MGGVNSGLRRDPNSKRSRLEAMRPGDVQVFICPDGISYPSLQSAIASELTRHLADIKTEFSQKKALLVFDEHAMPQACSVVTRKPTRPL